uniref:Death domain-associated protein 6 n=1 Tax=Cynoglossus semilaevis TaxID=244447 RepID=A0A3P8WWZ9_CYNSE
MAVAPAWMADKIIVLDEGDSDDSPQPSCSTSRSESAARPVPQLKAPQPIIIHVPPSPFATAKKQSHVLEAENQKLFSEFVEHCSALTQDCPEVLTFLQTKYAKASPDFLKSVEFRNTVGRCLTRAQNNRSKTFVFINELCTVLRQHCIKKRQSSLKKAQENGTAATQDERPSTSEPQAEERADRKTARASKKQIAYLENLLKVYHEEICRLQQTELSLDDMEAEDSLYIQEHKLKRKMMKIYEKLCELKDCSTLTGRVIEQRIPYTSTRFPEINRKIERYINSPEVRRNPPDYQDILQLVLRVNERQTLGLSKKELSRIALDAFRETGSQLQERRHLDLVFNFGSQLTDPYRPATDPALLDNSLQRKLRANREVALSRLEEVISKYAVKQEDMEEQDRSRRQEKEVRVWSSCRHFLFDTRCRLNFKDSFFFFQDNKPEEGEEKKAEEEEEQVTGGPLSNDSMSQASPSDVPSTKNSFSQSEAGPVDERRPLTNGKPEEPLGRPRHRPSSEEHHVVTTVTANGTSPPRTLKESGTEMTNGVTSDLPRVTRSVKRKRGEVESRSTLRTKHIVITDRYSTDPADTRGPGKRFLQSGRPATWRAEASSGGQLVETDIPLDMGVFCTTPPSAPPPRSSPPQAQTPTQDDVISLQSTPPPKRNKVSPPPHPHLSSVANSGNAKANRQ